MFCAFVCGPVHVALRVLKSLNSLLVAHHWVWCSNAAVHAFGTRCAVNKSNAIVCYVACTHDSVLAVRARTPIDVSACVYKV